MNHCLSHIKVLDLSRIFAGPWAGQFFADLGADVIKVERPGKGDDTREMGPPFLKDRNNRETKESAPFLSMNRGKKSITVDLSKPEGQAIIHLLAAQSDVIIENYLVGALQRYHLDYESIRAINPRIVYCSITGYGQSGPYSQRPGYDIIFQAMSGLMSVTGEADGRPGAGPQRVGFATSDITTAMYAIAAILAALSHRDHVSGAGQHIDLALLDSQVAVLSHIASNYFHTGQEPTRVGNSSSVGGPWGAFQCADQAVIIAVGNQSQFVRLCEVLGLPELPVDLRFSSTPERFRNRQEMIDLLLPAFKQRQALDLMGALDAAGVPCGPIYSMSQVLNDPQVQHRQLVVETAHPFSDAVKTIANPIKFSETPIIYRSAAPLLGEHTMDILRNRLGMPQSEIDRLAKAHIV